MADTDIDAINNKNTYNFYLVIEVPDHVYVLLGKILPIRIKDIYMIRYFYHKTEISKLVCISIYLGIMTTALGWGQGSFHTIGHPSYLLL